MANFKGMGYPLVPTPQGYFPVVTDVDLIKGDLLILLLTNPGERCMMPQYGTPLSTLIFDPNDSLLATKAQNIIANAIATWEPRVVITAINVMNGINATTAKGFLNPHDNLSQANNILGIQISFVDPNNIQSVQDLVLQVPLNSAGSTRITNTSVPTNSITNIGSNNTGAATT